MADNTLDVLTREFTLAVLPIRQAISSQEAFQAFMADLGWTVEDVPPPIADLVSSLDDLHDAVQPVLNGTPSLNDFSALREALQQLFSAIDALESATFDPALAIDNFASEFPKQLVQYLIIQYLLGSHPRIALVLRVVGLIRNQYFPPAGNRPDYIHRELALPDFTQLLADPVLVLERVYGWRTADLSFQLIVENLQDFMLSVGVTAFIEQLDDEAAHVLESNVDVPGDPLRYRLSMPLFEVAGAVGTLGAGVGLFYLPQHETLLPGLALLPYVKGLIDQRLEIADQLFLSIKSDLDLQGGVGVIARPNEPIRTIVGFNDPSSATSATGRLTFRLDYQDPELKPIVLIGSAQGSRVELKALSGVAGLFLDAQDQADVYVELELQDGRLIVLPAGGDGFLQKILPSDGFNARFDLALGYSSRGGFYFRGSSALAVNIPAHLRLGPLEVESLTVAAKPTNESLPITVGADIKLHLGPILATVKDLGIELEFSFPGSGGNLGPVDLDVGFKPPSGIGLSIDGGGFKGGGFLGFEPEEALYFGMLELEFQDQFTLKAFGLLNTRLPNGQSGFSLLIVISSEFTPIQLGLGFKLNGVGGLLGLNRTINIEPLRAGLRANTLNSILFPTDVVANADRIISDLKQVFPPADKRFIFGPMAKIAWGTPTLLTVDLGLVIEIPDPVRLVILGVLRAILPDEQAAILRVQVNFLGEINFERRQLKFDASLFDSKLLGFDLSGDMAIRLDWGADANFLLTVGGFHPAYEPPPMDLPAIRRITLALLSGDNPRLRLEMYFAVTSNTAQFGAKLELYAAASKFNVFGMLSFDVLFQFNPFYFIAEITATLDLRIGSSSIAGIKLTLTLEGPTPWKAKGTASFKICWFFTLKVRFNKTFGESRNTTLPDLTVLPLLTEALRANDNWEVELPPQRHRLESIREAPELAGQLMLHPVGTLRISQKVVPLNVAIDRIGSQRPSDGREFRIVNPQPEITSNTPQEAFAPAQFFDLTDEQKLTSASFKDLDSGVRVGDAAQLHTGYAAAREVKYEVKYIDSAGDQRLAPPRNNNDFDIDVGAFNTWTVQGAIAQSQISFARKRKSSLAPEAVVVSQEPFAIVNSNDLQLFDASSLLGSELAAVARLNELTRTNPNLRGTLQIVPAFELAA